MSTDPHRLPHDVVPSRYELVVDASLDDERFRGSVTIDARVVQPVDTIVCNAKGLTIDSVTLDSRGVTTAATVRYDHDAELLYIDPATPLSPSDIRIQLEYHGTYGEGLVGFYTSDYHHDGSDRRIGVTQFEAPYARMAFPCWDEPEFKAVFQISVVCDAGLAAVSNGAERSRTTLADGRVLVDFAPTMSMSTYLVAWVIGDLEASETVVARGIDIRVLHRPGHGNLAAFALEVAAHSIEWFEDYYGIAYPGDKLDLIAIPDFAFGAMENLGCVTFRESILLVDEHDANRSELERSATVIAHEIAHMWFGDLVTMRWWNGIWLNEAFATFMEFSCIDAFRPDWRVWSSFGLSKSMAFDTDALASTRPIEFEVPTPADAEAMFDILTYEKGASVLRMFDTWVGSDRFRDGIHRYLKEHSHANTDTADLWRALSAATGVDVGTVMDTWILQGGHPVIGVERTDRGVRLRQTPASFAGADPVASHRWVVPIQITAGNGEATTSHHVLLDGSELEVDLGGAPEWVNVNDGFNGFYRSAYSPELREALGLAAGRLDEIDRYALIDDAWAAFLGDRLDPVGLVSTVGRVAGVATGPATWRRIASLTGELELLIEPSDRPALYRWVAATTLAAAQRLGLEFSGEPLGGDDPERRDLRAVLFRLAGIRGGVDAVVERARHLFTDDAALDATDPDLAAAVPDVVARHGGTDEFDVLESRFLAASTPQEEMRALNSLTLFTDPVLVARLCELCRTQVRTQNAPFTLAAAMGNPVCGTDVWRFVSARWDELVERFPSSSIARMAGGIRAFAGEDLVAEISGFFAAHPVEHGALTVAQHLERTRVNAAARRRLGGIATVLDAG
ncbi:MAG: M1 family metallopeptidase [Microthrixaceae bacterium]